jgi:hypothetical protein
MPAKQDVKVSPLKKSELEEADRILRLALAPLPPLFAGWFRMGYTEPSFPYAAFCWR